jgi:carbon monoxide dehydrogenase subunit G
MPRSDTHFDAGPRDRGVTYYGSLRGRASAADVARAPGSVEEHARGHASARAGGHAAATASVAGEPHARGGRLPSVLDKRAAPRTAR